MKIYECYFDGSCEPKNPNGTMGYGVYIKSDDSEYWDAKQIPSKEGNTNNIAEYLGLLLILNLMIKKENSNIKIFGDSMMVVNQMNGTFGIKEGGYVPYAKKAKDLFNKIKEKNTLEITWIPREQNTVADDLSKSYVEGKYPIIKSKNVVTEPTPKNNKSNKVCLEIELPLFILNKSNTFECDNISKHEIIQKLISFGEDNLGKYVVDYVSNNEESIKFVEATSEEIDTNNSSTKQTLTDVDILWNTFKTILEKSIKNRIDFFEIYTETRFTDKQLDHIDNLGMVTLYYDNSISKYVVTINW